MEKLVLVNLEPLYIIILKNKDGKFEDRYIPMKPNPKNLYIITTARKRDTLEWEAEMAPFLLTTKNDKSFYYKHEVYVDSWNNIKKYTDVKDAFFIFDEQRVVGYGVWTKSFLKITKNNEWILLTATPGDTWSDYIPVFIANGFYKNKTEFCREHAIYSRYTKYPKIERYTNTGKLLRLRKSILINMDRLRNVKKNHIIIYTSYDIKEYKKVTKERWNPYTNRPIEQAGQLCYVWRRIVNESDFRVMALMEILEKTKKAIIFYNFDYELNILRNIPITMAAEDMKVAEWNGHKHEPIPKSDRWIYLVQYTAGAEGWNCTETNIIIFYSQNYSYKIMEQAAR